MTFNDINITPISGHLCVISVLHVQHMNQIYSLKQKRLNIKYSAEICNKNKPEKRKMNRTICNGNTRRDNVQTERIQERCPPRR